MFVAASFYLNMFYFLTLLVPTNPGAADLKKPEIAKFHAWLRDNGITSGTRQFTRIFINMFFMNSRALTFGIGLLFAVDIVFTLIAYAGGLPPQIALFVIVQSLIIIVFYGLIWKIEPFTSTFADNIDQVRTRLSRDLPPWIISILFLTGFLVVVFVFLTTIILLPGVTLNAFMTQSGLTELAYLFLPLGILAVSQYFIIRAIHGKTSRTMAERLMDYREHLLRNLIADAGERSAGPDDAEQRYEATSRLLESRIYQIKKNTLLGAFPVCVIDLDFSVMMDSTTLTAIKGYIRKPRQ
jgi:xanthosine utilization system XapX-like protein